MIIIKTNKEIEVMRVGGKILAGILEKVVKVVRPGVTTGDLENMACDLVKSAGGRPSFKGYRAAHSDKIFPTALCTSINEEIVHAPALPSRKLKSGDIIGVDLGMQYPNNNNQTGCYTDMAVTVGVGKISQEVKKLIQVTRKSLIMAIDSIKSASTLNDIALAIQLYAEKNGFAVVRDLVGHGVGREVHEEPQVPNYFDDKFKDIILKPGMTLAIEPMINAGSWRVKDGCDGHTVKTADNSLSAHFEHTVAVTGEGCKILTEL